MQIKKKQLLASSSLSTCLCAWDNLVWE